MINMTDLKQLWIQARRNNHTPKYFAMSPSDYETFVLCVLELSPYRIKHPVSGELEPTVLGVPVRSDQDMAFEQTPLRLYTIEGRIDLEI